jgi:hypothetical protein
MDLLVGRATESRMLLRSAREADEGHSLRQPCHQRFSAWIAGNS